MPYWRCLSRHTVQVKKNRWAAPAALCGSVILSNILDLHKLKINKFRDQLKCAQTKIFKMTEFFSHCRHKRRVFGPDKGTDE